MNHFTLASGTDVLRGFDRYSKPMKGDAVLILGVSHRTTSSGRSILLTVDQVSDLRDQLTEWLAWAEKFHGLADTNEFDPRAFGGREGQGGTPQTASGQVTIPVAAESPAQPQPGLTPPQHTPEPSAPTSAPAVASSPSALS